jgi:16S rRNA (guanine966-N2)-methyltransferase
VRITGGSLRGRDWPIQVGPGIRPTSSKVREALFSILGQDLSGWSVLDAFGGTGLLGVEAASRGAQSVLIVERNTKAVNRIRDGLARFSLDLEVRRSDVRKVLETDRFDLILMDPPYAQDPELWLQLGIPAAGRALVIETGAERELPLELLGMRCDRPRRYGDTQLGIYLRQSDRDE